ncbi:MAG: hypothetical protein FJ395_12840 [Verrucomicrobia bacterium]|nr:hypothetical protein [Verrucomicrobiota bacterium]
MVKRHYDVHGVRLDVAAENSVLADSLEGVLHPFLLPSNNGGADRLLIRYGTPPGDDELQGMKLLWRGEFPVGVPMEWYAEGRTRSIRLPGNVWARLDLPRRVCDIVVQPGAEWCLRTGCVSQVLCELLGEADHHVLHSACLAAGRDGQRRAVLLAGVSGAGKTTTALALAHAGLPLLTDDAAFLVRRDGAVRVWGLPRPCKVHRQTMAMMDWLKNIESRPTSDGQEFVMPLNRLSTADPRWELAPGLVVLIEPRNDTAHRLQEMNKVDALTELTRQNVHAMGGHAVERAGQSFQTIGALITASRVLRLSVGPGLDTLCDLLLAQLED